jgi:signal transduction histidine kinase
LKRLLHLLRSHLAVRIYLIGLAQVAVVFLGFTLFSVILRPPGYGYGQREAEYVVGGIARIQDPAARSAELEHARNVLRAAITLYDANGEVVATNITPPLPPVFRDVPMSSDRPGLRPPHAVGFKLPDGRAGRAVYALEPQETPPVRAIFVGTFVLFVVGIASLLMGRALADPLRRLSHAARAFGDGKLDARSSVVRADELGAVGRAFDEMADRVVATLEAHRELLANVSHELRTPLARMRVALDLAAEGDHATARESLSEIAEDVSELERVVSDVLAAARLERGALPLRPEATDVRSLLEKAAAKFRSAHPEHRLDVDAASVPNELRADPALLRRALDNVLDNAAKYTPPGTGPIVLHAEAATGGVEFEVRDSGIGIAPEDLPHVFTPFFRGDRSRTRATGGAGLGLALAKRIVDAHAGNMELASAPGAGTTVRIRIPEQAEPKDPTANHS